jgi:glycopeptide antibiotics resistance protein
VKSRAWPIRIQTLRFKPSLTVVLLIFWSLFIVYGTTIPFDFSASRDQVVDKFVGLIHHPWYTFSRMDVISNNLLFVPWGALLSFWLANRRVSFAASLIAATLGGAALSASVEFLQLFAPTRTSSLIDLLTNSFGSTIGALLGWLTARRAWPFIEPALRRLINRKPLMACSLLVAVGVLGASLSPFDVSIDVGELKSSLKKARLIPFGPSVDGTAIPSEPGSSAGEMIVGALLGGLFMLASRESGRSRLQGIAGVVILTGALSLAIEVLQLVVQSRQMDTTTVVWNLAGSVLGAWTVDRYRRVAYDTWVECALALWCVGLILSAWTPLDLSWPEEEALSPGRLLVPFGSYYQRTDVYALADLLNQVLIFVPAGALLAVRFPRISVWSILAIGVGFGLVLETGQLFLAGRTSEITDVLSAGVGTVLGLKLWRWGLSLRDPTQGVARYRVGAGAGLKDGWA